jgi:hypothetical protein
MVQVYQLCVPGGFVVLRLQSDEKKTWKFEDGASFFRAEQ